MYSFKHFLLFIFVSINFSLIHSINFSDVVNKKIDRVIDISTQLVVITYRITVENIGKVPLEKYLIKFDESHSAHLAYIEASILEHGRQERILSISRPTDKDLTAYWSIELDENKIQPGSSEIIKIEAVFSHLLEPYPTHITQSEGQLVLFIGNLYVLSPYLTKTQITKIKLPSSGNIESYTKRASTSLNDRIITYGPYEDVTPNNVSKIQIHVENNSPFLTVTSIKRSIEISHWAGVISVEEAIDMKHDGAILKGSFSRYDYQREISNGLSAVRNFKTNLPPTAYDIYYRDEIGNISTSSLKATRNYIIADLRPRFPLFGGWKTRYVIGYSLPAREYLFNSGSKYSLRMPFIDHIFDNFVVDEAFISVILPEGCDDIKARFPYSVIREKDKVYKTYLDTVGRTVISLRKNNLVQHHIQDFEIHYNFNRLYMLQEPMLILLPLFLLCLIVIVYTRVDFSLTKTFTRDSNVKISEVIESIIRHHDKRATIYSLYDQASTKCKANKDIPSYFNNTRTINADLKKETNTINDLINKLKSENASGEIMRKVNELQKLDKALREKLTQQTTLIEKLVSGKMNKQLYVETDSNLTKKKKEIAEKMKSIVSSF